MFNRRSLKPPGEVVNLTNTPGKVLILAKAHFPLLQPLCNLLKAFCRAMACMPKDSSGENLEKDERVVKAR